MSNYMVAFIVDGLREFEPGLQIGDKQISYITDLSPHAKEQLRIEMGKDLFDKLWKSSVIPCIRIHIDADDEKEAIKTAWTNAKQIANALSLVEFDQQDAMSMAYSHSPKIIPNVLVANMDEDSHSLDFANYTRSGLMRLSVGDFGTRAKAFNETVVRHIERLMPTIMWCNREFEDALMRRLVHSLHWYAIAMNQLEKELRFVAIWIALESLVIESIKTENKKRKIVSRLLKLYVKHNSEEVNDSVIEELWELRTRIVHEARSGFMEGSNYLISATDINLVKYFYFVAILFVLDRLEGNTSVSQVWQKLVDYAPSISIKYENMPRYLDYRDVFMSWQ